MPNIACIENSDLLTSGSVQRSLQYDLHEVQWEEIEIRISDSIELLHNLHFQISGSFFELAHFFWFKLYILTFGFGSIFLILRIGKKV